MQDIRETLSHYDWYHSIEVLPGVFTPGIEIFRPAQNLVLEALRATPLNGKRVLDIGCRDGLFAFEAEKLGAAEVVGIDNDLSRGATEVLIPHLKSKVQMRLLNVMDLTPETFGKFDVIIFAGVLYHLRYPIQALKVIRDAMADGATLIVETGVFTEHDNLALLWCPTGTDSPYEPTSVAFFNAKGLTDTLHSLGITTRSMTYLNGKQVPHDRATFVCTYSEADVDPVLRTYWDGSHRLHTVSTENQQFIQSHRS
ncbi:MAG TPA: class I SAM-dependent methyltransferase [Bryobacteraceae bacterium]|nr:class I SAM-dependent methyltransferase [Bryobacteraceae bacterium]